MGCLPVFSHPGVRPRGTKPLFKKNKYLQHLSTSPQPLSLRELLGKRSLISSIKWSLYDTKSRYACIIDVSAKSTPSPMRTISLLGATPPSPR
uniref:Uncharacterized protein n=1 Tax=Bionectria ochroleuca TaxID=29856 RepID=A0A0B7JNP6_BIOOC